MTEPKNSRGSVAANKKLIFATKHILQIKEWHNSAAGTGTRGIITRSLGRRRLDEGEADEDAVATTGAGGGGVHLLCLVPPGLGATRHACTDRQRKNQGKKSPRGGHGSIWLPLAAPQPPPPGSPLNLLADEP